MFQGKVHKESSPEAIFGVATTDSCQGLVTIDISLLFDDAKYTKPKIRNKKVDDCTIQELLFAVREKIKLEGG